MNIPLDLTNIPAEFTTLEFQMHCITYVIAFVLGVVYGSKIKANSQVLVLIGGLFIAAGLGNYPYYPVEGLATTYIAALVGVALGGVLKR
ncbi:MAG: hypothetical protein KKD39_07465 [Candidatus Altiarchaeota archaeon]|nr:hypothetical protein [Candidatus Altiarchaeota archaeon]